MIQHLLLSNNQLKYNVGIKRISIDEGDWAKEYNITVVPTIVVFNGKEVERFKADLSFAMKATQKDIQDIIDEILMEDF